MRMKMRRRKMKILMKLLIIKYMFIKMPVPTIFYKGWKEIKNLRMIKLGELCGLVFTGEFINADEPEFVGNEDCWKEFFNQLNLQNLN